MKILLGDFNAKVGREDIFKPTIGNENLNEISNDNRVRVVNFAISKDIIVKSTIFPYHTIHKYTWTFPYGKTRNQIDIVFIDKRWHSNMTDVLPFRGANCDADHHLVVVEDRD
jgi:endonuclease/exonuclease/phosphatase family metal-dependent hydrolase